MIENYIQKGLISAEQLMSLHGKQAVRLIDATYVLPSSSEKPYENYLRQRIGQAVYFDIGEICDKASDLPHMLPSIAVFESALSGMGIAPQDFVVVYGQKDTIMGPARVWWMFRVFGHDRVVVLDGGLSAWLAEGYPVEDTPPEKFSPISYKAAAFRQELVSEINDVMAASENRFCPVIDARPKARFEGSQPEPRTGLRSGHIPGSLNIPAASVVSSETGKLKSEEELKDLFDSMGLNSNLQHHPILSCGSGVTACTLGLALFSIGRKPFSVYDGSWSEWGQTGLDTKISKTV